MHDSALEELCRQRPLSIPELLRISGFGEYKAALYGPQIFEALDDGVSRFESRVSMRPSA